MSNIYRDLFEAYNTVYAPQEVDEATAMAKRGYDETKLRKRAGGGEAADRATKLADKSTFGDAKKAKQRQDLARAQRGDFRKTASSNPGLHVGQHKSDDPAVKAKQAARGAQRGALTPNERKQLNMGDETFDIFDVVLEFLQAEGFAETLEEAEWLMANVIDEEAIEIILDEEQLDEISQKTATKAYAASKTGEFEGADSDRDIKRSDNLRRHIKRKFGAGAAKHADDAATAQTFGRKDASGRSKKSPKPRIEKSDYRTTQDGKMHKQDQKELKTNLRIKRDRRLRANRQEEFEAWLDEAMTNYEKNRKRAAQRAAARNEARAQGKTGAVPGVGYVTPRKERETWTDESGKTRHAKGL